MSLTTSGSVQGRVRNLESGPPILLFRYGTIQEMGSEMYKRPLYTATEAQMEKNQTFIFSCFILCFSVITCYGWSCSAGREEG